MKDELSIILEAMRRAQAKVAFYLEPGNRNAEKAFKEIVQILDDGELMHAMQSLYGGAPSPSVLPDWIPEDDNTVSPDFARSS